MFGKVVFERLLIKASGLASPGPVVQTFELLPELREAVRFDGILTLAHAARSFTPGGSASRSANASKLASQQGG